ncbi:MAG: hypothetical protein P8099_05205 [Gemmatimonadota bacterium]|jgi:hypothetical protein
MTAMTVAPDPRIARLLARMRADGILLGPEAVLDAVERPQWDAKRGLQDWRNHVPPSVQQDWDALPLATRLCVYETAALAALADGAGAPMVTGPTDASS